MKPSLLSRFIRQLGHEVDVVRKIRKAHFQFACPTFDMSFVPVFLCDFELDYVCEGKVKNSFSVSSGPTLFPWGAGLYTEVLRTKPMTFWFGVHGTIARAPSHTVPFPMDKVSDQRNSKGLRQPPSNSRPTRTSWFRPRYSSRRRCSLWRYDKRSFPHRAVSKLRLVRLWFSISMLQKSICKVGRNSMIRQF